MVLQRDEVDFIKRRPAERFAGRTLDPSPAISGIGPRGVRVEEAFDRLRAFGKASRVGMDPRSEASTRRLGQWMIGSVGATVSVTGAVIAVRKFWP